MLKVLYGNLRFSSKIDIVFLPFKITYIIYTIPFLVFAILLGIKSFGAFGNPLNETFGIMKKILLHFAAIAISFGLWVFIAMMIGF